MIAHIGRDDSSNETVTCNGKTWTIQDGMWHVLSILSTEDMEYAGDPERGPYRGFAALHDLMDANMLLPMTDREIDNMVDVFPYWQRVQDLVSGFIICYHNSQEANE